MTHFPLRSIFLTGAASVMILAGAGTANASAFYLQEQSVRAVGRAFSGEAADQGAASLWWNPAAIANNDSNSVYGGLNAILPKGKVRDVNTLIVRPNQAPAGIGGSPVSVDPLNKGYLPSGGIGYRLNDQWAIGLAVTAPFSFATNYESDSWARYTADKTKLTTIDLQPTIAFAPTPRIGIGVAANIEYSKATLSNYLPNLSAALPDGHQTLRGKGWDIGWSAGVQFRPTDSLDLGFSYKSSVKHTLKGSIETTGLLGPLAGQNGEISGIKARFRTPWQAIASARVHVNDKFTLNGQVVRAGWKKFDAIRLGAPLNAEMPEGYKNSWSVAGGFDWQVAPEWTLRGGVQWDQTPTRDGFRDARVPDASRINYAVGTSYAVTDAITLDMAVNYTDFRSSTIDRVTAAYAGTQVQTPMLVDGRIDKARALVLGIGGRMTF